VAVLQGANDRARLISAAVASPLLADLSADAFDAATRGARLVQAPERGVLVYGTSDTIILLLEGTAKRSAITPRDGPIITQLLGPGQTAGLLPVLGYPGADGSVEALEHCTALSLAGTHVRQMADEVPTFARSLLRAIAVELAEVRLEQSRLAGGTARERVIERLVQLRDRFGIDRGGYIDIPVPLTQDDLAAWAFVSRESTARVLHDLRTRGIVRTARRRFTIEDTDALDGLRGEASSRAAGAAVLATLRGLHPA
jgi:CRP/FNR family transcriptional regulator, cyclic AMP receptor protein